jgi:hypothetical protein
MMWYRPRIARNSLVEPNNNGQSTLVRVLFYNIATNASFWPVTPLPPFIHNEACIDRWGGFENIQKWVRVQSVPLLHPPPHSFLFEWLGAEWPALCGAIFSFSSPPYRREHRNTYIFTTFASVVFSPFVGRRGAVISEKGAAGCTFNFILCVSAE